MKIKTVWAASPSQGFSDGMTLRDYFAAKALPSVYAHAIEEAEQGSGLFNCADWRVGIALDSYSMADAMLAARVKEVGND